MNGSILNKFDRTLEGLKIKLFPKNKNLDHHEPMFGLKFNALDEECGGIFNLKTIQTSSKYLSLFLHIFSIVPLFSQFLTE